MFLIMKIWRTRLMNDQEVKQEMIDFIEQKEKELQQEKFLSASQIKNDVVKSIMAKLDEVIKNEDIKN